MTVIRIQKDTEEMLSKISVHKHRLMFSEISKNFLLNEILRDYCDKIGLE